MRKILLGIAILIVIFFAFRLAVAQNTENVDPAVHIRNVVLEGTPDFISALVLNTVNWFENLREGNTETPYVGFIFRSQWLFYGLLGVFVFYLARLVSRKIFKF